MTRRAASRAVRAAAWSLVLLLPVACGGGLTAHTAGNATGPATTTGPAPAATSSTSASAPTPTFKILLTGAGVVGSPGASGGSLPATIKLLDAATKVCWSFGKLVGVPHPTRAQLNQNQTGINGTPIASLGRHFALTGCAQVAPYSASYLLERPPDFNITVYSHSYPNGAIRGQL